MFKLTINLYNRSDRYIKKYPVIIRSGNIETLTQFPKIAEKIVRFNYKYSKEFEMESEGKVNTRFSYPYSEYYIKSGDAGSQKLYAKLNRWQRFILSLINKDSIVHRKPYKVITIIIGILTAIALYIPLCSPSLVPNDSPNNLPESQNKKQEATQSQVEIDSLQPEQSDTLTKSDTTSTK